MKNTFVITHLVNYDKNRGYGRWIVKDEPHIKELRGFVAGIEGKERDLTAAELLSLVRILLGKPNRSEEQLSSQIFKSLAQAFGGFEVLDFLQQKGALNDQCLGFILSLNDKLSSIYRPQLLKVSRDLLADDCLFLFEFLDTSAKQDHLIFYVMFLDCLFEHCLPINKFLPILKDTKEIIFAHSVTKTLINSKPVLLTVDNVTSILQLKQPCEFNQHLEELPITQTQLASLFELDGKLGYWSPDIIKIFKTAEWDLNPWLQQILTSGGHSYTLSQAIARFEKNKNLTNKLSLVLPCLFANPKQALNFVEALEIVSKSELLEEDLQLLQRATLYPVPVAKAIVALKAANLFIDLNINLIIANAEHALGLANMVIVFEKLKKLPYLEAHRIIQEHPEYAGTTARVLECLLVNQLDQAVNIRTVCKDRQSHALLLNLMNVLKQAKLLDQNNFDLLISQNKHFKTLKSAANCLSNAEKLDQSNFEQLINDPLNALFFAEKQGGKVYPCTFKYLTDKGAVSFVTVREKARVMAQGHRQGLFFAEHTYEKTETFVKATGKTIAQAEHEAVLKIAEYCGSAELESDTTQHIASTSYYSSSPGR